MKTAIRRVPLALTLLPLALIVLALSAGSAHGAVGYTKETLAEFEAQLKAGQIQEATINKRLRSVRLSLNDGRHLLAKYPPHEEPKVLRELRRQHVRTTVLTEAQAKLEHSKKPVKHKLRYIAGGIVLALIVIVGGVLLYNRRRRESAAP